jgi:hypothetical protein
MTSIRSKSASAGITTALGLATAAGARWYSPRPIAQTPHPGTAWPARGSCGSRFATAPRRALWRIQLPGYVPSRGTLSESTSDPGVVGQRGPGSGNWAVEKDHSYKPAAGGADEISVPPANLPGTPDFDPTRPASRLSSQAGPSLRRP